MGYKVFSFPNFSGTASDLMLCNVEDPNANGVLHYAYAVGAEDEAVLKRSLPWAKIQDFRGAYGTKYPDIIKRLKDGVGYRPGEDVLDSADGATFATDQDTIMRLGALELLANLSSGRLSTNDKDPFPHQLALQQYIRKPPKHDGPRRILIADEVGLGKTIEVGLILRDILLARGKLDGFRCLYLTSGGLVPDVVDKLRDVLSGIIDGDHIVEAVPSFRGYGSGTTLGVHVASMHAARLYTTEKQKNNLPVGVRPQIIIIDECHHAASDGDLAGVEVRSQVATQTYVAAKQLLAGEFWPESEVPQLGILMSATPFRSAPQFVNLLRLLTDGVERPNGGKFGAFDAGVQASELRSVLQDEQAAASVVWRRQSDEEVRSWSGGRIFPNLTVRRPHQVPSDDCETPHLPLPSGRFLNLLHLVKSTVAKIARAHGQGFGGFAIAQLEKKLTSSSIAGACWIFSWAVRHCQWDTQVAFNADKRPGTEALRRLIRSISKRIAEYNDQSKATYATVSFPSDRFSFEASSLAQAGGFVSDIQKYSKTMREEAQDSSNWVAEQNEIVSLVELAEQMLGLGSNSDDRVSAEDAKLAWLNELLTRHPDDRVLLFTESLQTCETLRNALGSKCRVLEGSMTKAARNQAVADLRNPRMNARVLVATSAADEGFDLQVARKVVHWDLSSSPATLMQRNGRVARLGQVVDVVAYYLILSGTHEERRDSALQARFADLGIDDEALKSRILGSLSEEEEALLEQAIEENQDAVVGRLLKKAAKDNEKMDEELAEIRITLQHAQVLSREDLESRLRVWDKLGLPEAAIDGVRFKFDSITWDRPVFGEVSRMESCVSTVARIADSETKQELIFDPEFLVFGPKVNGGEIRLAGIPPWINVANRHGKHGISPFAKSDLMGTLLHGMARLKRADFLAIPRSYLKKQVVIEDAARWLLFCTHPLREAENTQSPKPRPYLTYYAFSEVIEGVIPKPLKAEGAGATEVHDFLTCIEQLAVEEVLSGLENENDIASARTAGKVLQSWIESVTKFGAASFLEEDKYFVPLPVAFISIVNEAT